MRPNSTRDASLPAQETQSNMHLPQVSPVLSTLWPPRDTAERDVCYGLCHLRLLSSGTKVSLLLFMLHMMLWGMGFGPEGEGRRGNLFWGWKVETIYHVNIIFSCFLWKFNTHSRISFPLSCSSIIKAMVRKYLNEKLLMLSFFTPLLIK